MPVHVLVWRDGARIRARRSHQGQRWIRLGRQPASEHLRVASEGLDAPTPAEGEYVSEMNLAGRRGGRLERPPRHRRPAAHRLRLPRAEYYLPSPQQRHTAVLPASRPRRPVSGPGLNDITAFRTSPPLPKRPSRPV